MSPPDVVIRLEQVSVRYRLLYDRTASFKEYVIRRLKGRVPVSEFFALQDVSLTVGRGETIGVIGANGAGKTTLLRLIARALRPTAGRVWVRGHVASLLQLGLGFDYELTGRENIFLNAAILGARNSEISRHLDGIIAFADIGEFIDRPMRMYSTGMVTRLAFAVATALQPDILVLDEVLSVGDAAFQKKSGVRLADLQRRSKAIVMASHSLGYIHELCQRVVWLDQGHVRALGPPSTVISEYVRTTDAQARDKPRS